MSVAVLGVAGTVALGVGAAGAAASIYSANSASDTQGRAIDAQGRATEVQAGIADRQQQLAQDQWNYQRDVYLPRSMQMADDSAALTRQVANRQMANMDYNEGVSRAAVAQASQSYRYQDQYMGLTDKYANGEMSNTMANEAGSDVAQASGMQRATTMRNMERMGVNPGSGAGMAMMHDDQNAEALASAGAQTNARKLARDKAEQMVGIAAGSGAAGFGTGMSAGALATGNGAAAGAASASGNAVLNGVNAGTGANYSGVNSSFNGGSFSARGSGSTAYGLQNSPNGNPMMDAIGGGLNGLSRSGAFGGVSDFFNRGNYTTPNSNGSYNSPPGSTYNYRGDSGISGPAGDFSDTRWSPT